MARVLKRWIEAFGLAPIFGLSARVISSWVLVTTLCLGLVGVIFLVKKLGSTAVGEEVSISLGGTAKPALPIEIDTEIVPPNNPVENSLVAIVEDTGSGIEGMSVAKAADTSAAVADGGFSQESASAVELDSAAVMPLPPKPLVSLTEKILFPLTAQSVLPGSGVQRFDQLRAAIESKSMDRVLVVSDQLPRERIEFLRTLFRRYAKLDATVYDVAVTDNSAMGELSVKMSNRHSDSSYYSAGEWSDVTLRVDKVDGSWRQISW